METGQLIGFIAAGLSCVAALPHLMKSWRDGTQGVSSAAWILAAVNSTLWIAFAVMTHTYATLISSVANGLIAGAILFLIFNEQRIERQTVEEIVAQPASTVPYRTPVAVQMKRLSEENEKIDQTFSELTRTLEFEFLRETTGQLEPVV